MPRSEDVGDGRKKASPEVMITEYGGTQKEGGQDDYERDEEDLCQQQFPGPQRSGDPECLRVHHGVFKHYGCGEHSGEGEKAESAVDAKYPLCKVVEGGEREQIKIGQ